ncbi:MAG: hypothetical protein M3O32_09915 [Actinomycetota bacterium]|nr:hypothetical protein [Actinomycetota bacterium]
MARRGPVGARSISTSPRRPTCPRSLAAAIGVAVIVGGAPVAVACSKDNGDSPTFTTTSETGTSPAKMSPVDTQSSLPPGPG